MQQAADLSQVSVGYIVPPLHLPPITRTTLARYAGASGDYNPMHVDIDMARKAGLDDVFAHGMLSAAYLGRLITDWAGQERLRSMSFRFTDITAVHDAPSCTGEVIERFVERAEERLRVAIQARSQDGSVKILGQAVVSVYP